MNASGAAPTYATGPAGIRPVDGNGHVPDDDSGQLLGADPAERTAAALEALAEIGTRALATLTEILARLER